jgi:hypothetical protein
MPLAFPDDPASNKGTPRSTCTLTAKGGKQSEKSKRKGTKIGMDV